MQISEINRAVSKGEQVATDVAASRASLRHNLEKGDSTRKTAIEGALELIDAAMKPIRSMIGKLMWDPPPEEQDRALRAVSKRLQYERKQLKKMRA